MADDEDLISTDNQFLIEYYWEDLVKRMNISSSSLIDILIGNDVLTHKEGEDLKIKEKYVRQQAAKRNDDIIDDGVLVKILLKKILTKTNRDFRGLCEGLESEGQGFLVKNCLSQEAAAKACKNLQEALSEYYMGSYTDSMFTYDTEEHRVDLSEMYVPIRWVTQEKCAEGVTEKKLENYREIFHKESGGKPVRVIVKGEPSSGKTIFMKKVCFEWSTLHKNSEDPVSSEIRDTLGQYDLFIPIILRLVKRGASLEQTIQEQIDLNDKQMLTLHYMLKKKEKTVLVLDGLDEFNTTTSRDITDIMRGNTFKHVIITSRAEAVKKTQEWKQVMYKEAELKGFSDEHIKLYIDKFFKISKDLASSLISHIFQKDSNLLDLARNPGNLCMVCILHKDKLPIHAMNREQLFQEYVAFLLSRWEQRQNPEEEKTPRSEILKKYHEILLKFGELADINRKHYDLDGEYERRSFVEDSLELSFTMDQITSVIGENAFNFGFLYKSHPSSCFKSSRFSFTHKILHEFFLAYFIHHSNFDSFKQRIYKNWYLLEQELSLTRFILHLYMSPNEAFEFTTNTIGSKPDEKLFFVLLKLYQGCQDDEYQTTITFCITKYGTEYCFIYQYPCYVIHTDRRHQDSLSSYNKDMIRRMNTDNKHKAVTVPILQTASKQLITCGDHPTYLSGYDFRVYCRPDYEVTVTGDGSKLKRLYLDHIEKMGDINLNSANDSLEVVISYTNLHGHVMFTKPWMALIQSLEMCRCKLEADDMSIIADSIQACTSPTGAESASPCRLQKLHLRGNSLTGAGADIARIISCIPLCTSTNLAVCGLNDEDFHAIVNAIIQTHSDRHTSVHDHSTPDIKYLLYDNKFSDVEPVRLLLDNLPPSLSYLILCENQFNEEETEEIIRTYTDKHPNLELIINH